MTQPIVQPAAKLAAHSNVRSEQVHVLDVGGAIAAAVLPLLYREDRPAKGVGIGGADGTGELEPHNFDFDDDGVAAVASLGKDQREESVVVG